MKKILLVISMCVMSVLATVSFAKTTTPGTVNLQLKVDYKNNAAEHAKERVFNSNVQLNTKHWEVVGKMLSEKNNNLMIVMAKLMQQQNDTYTIQFMLVDSGASETVVFEPQAKVVAGAPADVSISEGTRTLDIHVLAS